jgi:hypothetical protein
MPPDDRGAGYLVVVDDNFHYMDEDARSTFGRFATLDAALAVCRTIVDRCLEEAYQPGMTAKVLVSAYKGFGDDPFILPPDGAPVCHFSAWDYAQQRAEEMCRGRAASPAEGH